MIVTAARCAHLALVKDMKGSAQLMFLQKPTRLLHDDRRSFQATHDDRP